MARRLKTIARFINEQMPSEYTAVIEEGYCNTDRMVPGRRIRIPGKGQWGNRLIVKRRGEVVLDHNAAETYRTNEEVERWLEDELQWLKDGRPICERCGDHMRCWEGEEWFCQGTFCEMRTTPVKDPKREGEE